MRGQGCTTGTGEREHAPFWMQTRRRQCQDKRGSAPPAVGLSLLLLGLQLSGLAHLTLERHGVCWEHGTLTELGTVQPRAALPPDGMLPGFHVRPSRAGLDAVDGHHHCPVQASRRDWGCQSCQ